MAGRTVQWDSGKISLADTFYHTFFQFIAPANQHVYIRNIRIICFGSSGADAKPIWEIVKQTNAGTPGSSGDPAGVILNQLDTGTVQLTAKQFHTGGTPAEPTAGAVYQSGAANTLGSDGQNLALLIAAGTRMGVRLKKGATPSTLDVQVQIVTEE